MAWGTGKPRTGRSCATSSRPFAPRGSRPTTPLRTCQCPGTERRYPVVSEASSHKGSGVMRRLVSVLALLASGAVMVLAATPAAACGGLVAPNGAVRLDRTTTLAAYHDGVEHYVTSFQYAGGVAN